MKSYRKSEFLGIVRARHPETIRIMLTGQASLEATIRAINEGEIYRFFTKPCNPVQLAHTIRDALAMKSLMRESSRLLGTAKRQRSLLEELELEHPGITHVEKTDDGSIALEVADQSIEDLIREMSRESTRDSERRRRE